MIGLDQGTTNCKAVLLDAEGHVRASAAEGYRLQVPQPGWAEQDVRELWQGMTKALRRLMESAPVPPTGLCLSGAMHSLFPVTEDGTPLANAMTWADSRASREERQLLAECDAHAVYLRTGCPVRSTYHPVRLRWFFEEAPYLDRQAARFVGLKDWVLHALTGVWATDLGLASTTGLLDIHKMAWDEEALRLGGVSADRLPALVSPSAVVGTVTPEAAAVTGLPVGLPVVAGGSDGGMASLGSGIVDPGQTVITVGTSGAVRRIVDRPWLDPRERTWCYALTEDRWFIGGAINNGGLAMEWVRNKLYPEFPGPAGWAEMNKDAASIRPGAEGVFLLPYFTGERSPYWAPNDSAMIYGLRVEHTRAHLARAAMEGVADCLADVWEALEGTTTTGEAVRLTGGITRAPTWAQVLADVLGSPLTTMEVADASATGAALMGMRGVGQITGSQWAFPAQLGTTYRPNAERHAFYLGHHRAFQVLHQGMALQGETLATLQESDL